MKTFYRFTTLLSMISLFGFVMALMAPTDATAGLAPQSSSHMTGPLRTFEINYHDPAYDPFNTSSAGYYEGGQYLTVEGLAQAIDNTWLHIFSENGWYYKPVVLIQYDVTLFEETECGVPEPGWLAFYCNGSVFFDKSIVDREWAEKGDYAVANLLAHEWGHHIQALTGAGEYDIETNANCYIGVFMARAEGDGLYTTEFTDASYWFMEEQGHASGEEWLRGYYDGAAGCGVEF